MNEPGPSNALCNEVVVDDIVQQLLNQVSLEEGMTTEEPVAGKQDDLSGNCSVELTEYPEDPIHIGMEERPPEDPTPPKRKRGRPPKSKLIDDDAFVPEEPMLPRRAKSKQVGRRSRPTGAPKRKYTRRVNKEGKQKDSSAYSEVDDNSAPHPKKRRGRPPKNSSSEPNGYKTIVFPISLAPPEKQQKPGKRGRRRTCRNSSSSDSDDEFERMTRKETPERLSAIDKFHYGIIQMTTNPDPGVGPGLALLPFETIYKVHQHKDPGFTIIHMENESAIFQL